MVVMPWKQSLHRDSPGRGLSSGFNLKLILSLAIPLDGDGALG